MTERDIKRKYWTFVKYTTHPDTLSKKLEARCEQVKSQFTYIRWITRAHKNSYKIQGFVEWKGTNTNNRCRKTQLELLFDNMKQLRFTPASTEQKEQDEQANINTDDHGNMYTYNYGMYTPKGDKISLIYEDKIMPGRIAQKDDREMILAGMLNICRTHVNNKKRARVECDKAYPRFTKDFETQYKTAEAYRDVDKEDQQKQQATEWFEKHGQEASWQKMMWQILSNPPHDRYIYILRDYEGNTGKSTWSGKYTTLKPGEAKKVKTGKSRDLTEVIYNYKDTINTVFIDLPRTDIETFAYGPFERIKNGDINREKWESDSFTIDTPHMIIFTNGDIDYTGMSTDRWQIYDITRPAGMDLKYSNIKGPLDVNLLINKQQEVRQKLNDPKWTDLNPKRIKVALEKMNAPQQLMNIDTWSFFKQTDTDKMFTKNEAEDMILAAANIGRLQEKLTQGKDRHLYLQQLKQEEMKLHTYNLQAPPHFTSRNLSNAHNNYGRQNDIKLNDFLKSSPIKRPLSDDSNSSEEVPTKKRRIAMDPEATRLFWQPHEEEHAENKMLTLKFKIEKSYSGAELIKFKQMGLFKSIRKHLELMYDPMYCTKDRKIMYYKKDDYSDKVQIPM